MEVRRMSNAPSQVLIIRHGEKVGDPKKDDDGGRHLSVQGSARAATLPSLFVTALPQLSCGLHHKAEAFHGRYRQIPIKGKASRFLAPNYIFATQRSKNSNRPVETVIPLGTALIYQSTMVLPTRTMTLRKWSTRFST